MAAQPRPLISLGDESLRDSDTEHPLANMQETSWAVARLSEFGLERLSTFLLDLSKRYPFDGPAWAPHRLLLEALEADVRRELVSRRTTNANPSD